MAVPYITVQTEQTIIERVTDKLDWLDAIDKQIREEFEKLLLAIEVRRNKLIERVNDMRKEFEAKRASIVENLRGLENLREHIKVMPEKQDCVVMKKQQKYFDAILYRYLMATANVTGQTRLDVIREEIIQVFERILSEVRARRDVLLEQVSKMKIEFEAKNISMTDNLRGLTEMRTHYEKMSAKQNLAMKKQQESLADIDSDIEKLKIELSNKSKFRFNCSINQLIERVKQFGEVIDESCIITQYQSKLTATRVITKYQDYKFGDSTKLHIDHDRQLLYVLNSNPPKKAEAVGMRRKLSAVYEIFIAVFNANDFTFIVQFGGSEYFANCIATSQEFVYVGHSYYGSSKLIQYKKSDCSIVKTLSTTSPIGIMCSENLVYVLTYSDKTFKFQIYDRALNFKEERDLCYEWPEYKPTISAKQIQELFYILFNTHILVFTKEGKNTHSIILGKSTLIKNPTTFCVDLVGNFIVTDSATNSIKFFSPEGDLFHTIGKGTVGSDEVAGATDIVAYNGTVVVSTRDGRVRMY